MYKETLRGIAGIDIFPVLSLVLFVLVFAVVLYRVGRMKGPEVRRCAALPLECVGGLAEEERGHDHG